MANRVLVGNTPLNATEEDLKAFFSTCGHVKIVDIPRNEKGKAKGFAIIEMASRKEAILAQSTLANTPFAGRKLTITLKEELPPESHRSLKLPSWLRIFKAN